jgi:uncharacterized membrane protein
MESLMKSDIFFFITTVVVVLLGIFALVAIVYIIKIVKTVRKISETVKKTVDMTNSDFNEVREHLKDEAINFALPSFLKKKPKPTNRKNAKSDTE